MPIEGSWSDRILVVNIQERARAQFIAAQPLAAFLFLFLHFSLRRAQVLFRIIQPASVNTKGWTRATPSQNGWTQQTCPQKVSLYVEVLCGEWRRAELRRPIHELFTQGHRRFFSTRRWCGATPSRMVSYALLLFSFQCISSGSFTYLCFFWV